MAIQSQIPYSSGINQQYKLILSIIHVQFLWPTLPKILGSLKYLSSKSILHLFFISRLCLRTTFLSFCAVESTPEIKSSSFSIFWSEGRAVSTFLSLSIVSFFKLLSLLLIWKEGVLISLLEMSAPICLEMIGEGMSFYDNGSMKKSGGSFELLILILRLIEILWLRWLII